MDINKIITESISNLINEDKSAIDTAKEAVTKAADVAKDVGGKVDDTTKDVGGKVAGFVKKAAKEGKEDFVRENPKSSAAIAAALAAGLGAVAFRKKLAALAKKGMPVAKKKTAEVAKKIAKKLES